jgi:molybdenum cofactor biosynthesis enzyme MoaA
VRLGVQNLRITGGVPLIRKGILTFGEAMCRPSPPALEC